MIAAQLDARAVHLLDCTALGGERVNGHERRAHRSLCQAKVVRTCDLERLSERVERLRGVATTGADIDKSGLGPAQGGYVGALLLQCECTEIRSLRDIELAEQMMELREG